MESFVKIFQVSFGDAIWIRYIGNDNKPHNIFIDSGFAGTYARTIKRATQDILKRGERIDAFIITHIDRDHIKGALKFIEDYGQDNIVGEYWFNGKGIKISEKSDKITYSEGIKLRNYLVENNQKVRFPIHKNIAPISLFGAKFTFFSPCEEDLENFKSSWTERERGLVAARKNDYADTIEDLSKKRFCEDDRIEHKACIAFLFECMGKSLLFLGDTIPTPIIRTLEEKEYSKDRQLTVDYVKLSHHASKYNTNFDVIERISCRNFIISANGTNVYRLPHKEALSRILCHPLRETEIIDNEVRYKNTIHFIFNYDNAVIRSIFNKTDPEKYNFKCCYPERNESGYSIKL